VPDDQLDELLAGLAAVRRIRLRTGAVSWRSYRDAEQPDRVLEQFTVPSWEEHLRQHSGRLTGADQQNLDRVRALSNSPPRCATCSPCDPGLGAGDGSARGDQLGVPHQAVHQVRPAGPLGKLGEQVLGGQWGEQGMASTPARTRGCPAAASSTRRWACQNPNAPIRKRAPALAVSDIRTSSGADSTYSR